MSAPSSAAPHRWPHADASLPLALLFVAALWAICHPYTGIDGDSKIYLGRVLADLDPSGLGSDLMFANDGQSKFSLFPIVARPLVAALGASSAGIVIAGLASTCWILALFALARGLASGRTAWAMILAVALLPVGYGQTGIFSFGETSAIPRPFAEAAVMAALAALLGGRSWLAGGMLLLAVLIHPIMALAGICVFAVIFTYNRRCLRGLAGWAALAVGSAIGLLLAGLGVPLFERLIQIVDQTWMTMLLERSTYLFPTLWYDSAFAPIAVQSATIAIAAQCASPAPRRVYIAVLITGATGLAVAILFADKLHLLLFIQVQTWRMTWLLGVVGGCAFAFCAAALWERDNLGRVVLALLGFAWFFQPSSFLTIAAAGFATALYFATLTNPPKIQAQYAVVVYSILGALIVSSNLSVGLGYIDFLRNRTPDVVTGLIDPLRNNLHSFPLCLLAAWWLLAPRPKQEIRAAPIALGVGACLLAVINFAVWDQRTADAKAFEHSNEPLGFAALMAGRPQEVLWLDGLEEAWFTLGHPQYLSALQAASSVFSRPLAVEWHRRAELLASLGLVRRAIFQPWATIADDDDRLHVTQAGLDSFCQRQGAPGSVVIPIEYEESTAPFSGMIVWTLHHPHHMLGFPTKKRLIGSYAIVPCAPKL
jgi:hypothetical protein